MWCYCGELLRQDFGEDLRPLQSIFPTEQLRHVVLSQIFWWFLELWRGVECDPMLLVPNNYEKHDENNQNNLEIQYFDHISCHHGEINHIKFGGGLRRGLKWPYFWVNEASMHACKILKKCQNIKIFLESCKETSFLSVNSSMTL